MGYQWQRAWITGASRGIGSELALFLAQKKVHVAISARSKDKLDTMAQNSDRFSAFSLDVTDRAAVRATVGKIEQDVGPLDLAILNAGIREPVEATDFDASIFERAMRVNYFGIIYALEALIPRMIERGAGHIVLIGSLSGYRGMPKAAAYGPTKAALINLAETLKLEVECHGIQVSIVNPGFIDTPMTEKNEFPMPFIMSPKKAARKIISGLECDKYVIAFPGRLVWPLRIFRLLPNTLYFWIVRSFISKTWGEASHRHAVKIGQTN